MQQLPIQRVLSLDEQVRRLEKALVLSLDTLAAVVELLESKFGSEFLGTTLTQLAPATPDADLQSALTAIERSIGDGEKSAAARLYRDSFGCTWDQAHQAVGQWGSCSREEKIRRLRLAAYIKSVESGGPK